MDHTGDGLITMDHLKHFYNVKASPRYQAGEDSEESILLKFLANFEKDTERDGKVSSSSLQNKLNR